MILLCPKSDRRGNTTSCSAENLFPLTLPVTSFLFPQHTLAFSGTTSRGVRLRWSTREILSPLGSGRSFIFRLKVAARKTNGSAPLAIIQARFGSRRFPGKVLANFRGKKVLEHVLRAAGDSCGKDRVILATSKETQDDAVAKFASDTNRKVYRGSLENVWSRFQEAVLSTEAEWVVRICADSPLLPSSLIRSMVNLVGPDIDLVTNVHPRTFPHGYSVEILHRRLFIGKEFFPQNDSDREHVTPHLYRIPNLRILNHVNPLGNQSGLTWSVEDAGDIERLEKLCPG